MVFCAHKKSQPSSVQNGRDKKPKRKDKCDLGENFIAPDGGWGWLICVASGLSHLVAFPVLQQFGLLFRERLNVLGLTNAQITTIINANTALSACTGLLNGPMFRRFSYRQVALAGAAFTSCGIFLTSIANSFFTYIITFSVLYGIGLGISISSISLALNTYFKEKRRMATGFAWTITAFGPIIMPYAVTGLVDVYGVQGSVMIFSAFAMNTFAFALIYQPVLWHVKRQPGENKIDLENAAPEYKCTFCRLGKRKNTGLFCSQYLYNADDTATPGYEITDPGTPMMSRANDGWYSKSIENYGSKCSLASGKFSRCMSFVKEPLSNIPLKESDEEKESCDEKTKEKNVIQEISTKSNTFNLEKETLKMASSRLELYRKCSEVVKCTCEEERKLLKSELLEEEEEMRKVNEERKKLPILRKIAIFFDLDLLKDSTYVNLMVGLTLANFTEINFSILTPFILIDFGYTKEQSAFAMSILAGMDTSIRFIIPFFVEKIGWDNRTFFLIGIVGMGIGRMIIAHTRSYTVMLIVFVWIGINKGLRTIFMALVIPSHVPLKRLPAASGLQLVFMGLFSFTAGPIIGLVRDATDYTITLHCLNIATFVTVISWILEKVIRSFRMKKKLENN